MTSDRAVLQIWHGSSGPLLQCPDRQAMGTAEAGRKQGVALPCALLEGFAC